MKKNLLALSVAALIASGCSTVTSVVDITPVSAFDVERFVGTWYELARFDHSFEKGDDHAQAQYSVNPDSTITVVNRAMNNGVAREVKGKVRLTKTPGLMRVSFFGPFYSDYRVLFIDETYSHALIGSGSSDYLWVLCRSQKPDLTVLAKIMSEAKRRGYDVSSLIWVNQD